MKPSRLVIGSVLFLVGAITGDALSATPLLAHTVALVVSVVVAVLFIIAVFTHKNRSL